MKKTLILGALLAPVFAFGGWEKVYKVSKTNPLSVSVFPTHPSHFQITLDRGDVEIVELNTAKDNHDVQVRATYDGEKEASVLVVETQPGHIGVGAVLPTETANPMGWGTGGAVYERGDRTIHINRGGTMNGATRGGTVVSGNLKLRVMIPSIMLKNLNVDVKKIGNVAVTGLSTPPFFFTQRTVDVFTNHGDIEAHYFNGSALTVKTNHGNVELAQVKTLDGIVAQTNHGRVLGANLHG